jgi:hypothetical protein
LLVEGKSIASFHNLGFGILLLSLMTTTPTITVVNPVKVAQGCLFSYWQHSSSYSNSYPVRCPTSWSIIHRQYDSKWLTGVVVEVVIETSNKLNKITANMILV